MTKPKKETAPMEHVMSVRFPAEVIPILEKEAYAEGLKTSVLVRQLVIRCLKKRKDYRKKQGSGRSLLSYDD